MLNKLEGKDFKYIKDIFDGLNEDKSHFTSTNDICTPMECVKDMVDSIPNDFWDKKDLKILDCCSGNGNFHGYIQQKTGISNLYFNEINKKRIKNCKHIFGNEINMSQEDFLVMDDKIKYDLIVANPPYAKFSNGKRVSKNHNLSRDFISKAVKKVKEDGYLLFIVPNNWMSYADRNKLPKELTNFQFIHLNIHGAKKYFPKVGSSFTWFLIQKKNNNKKFIVENNYILKDKKKVRFRKNMNFIPLYCSEDSLSLMEKVTDNKGYVYNVETSSYLHRYTKQDKLSNKRSKTYKYKVIHTPSQTLWSKEKHKFQEGYKVFISLTNQYSTFIDNCGMTQSVAFIRCKTEEEAIKIKEELDSPVYKTIVNLTRYGNFNNIRVIQNMKKLSKIKLNEKENKFIEKFNKEYYEKKK